MDLNQVTLPARDVRRAAGFYQSLGLTLIVESFPKYARLLLPTGGATLSLEHTDVAPGQPGAHVYFECPDLDATSAALQRAGIAFDGPPVDQSWLWREAWLTDPEGNRLCLFWAGRNRIHPPWRLGSPVRSSAEVTVRPATDADRPAVGAILTPIIRAGETLALPRDLSEAQMLDHWFSPGHWVFVAIDGGEVRGTYYLHANQQGAGAHVANCGYATSPAHSGRGIARAMCAHSLQEARAKAFRAMQFNLVVSTNVRAVRLWQSMRFDIVGRLPGAFAHPTLGPVDALVMFQAL